VHSVRLPARRRARLHVDHACAKQSPRILSVVIYVRLYARGDLVVPATKSSGKSRGGQGVTVPQTHDHLKKNCESCCRRDLGND